MLTLQLYQSEFRDLIGYLRAHTRGHDQLPLAQQNVALLVMLQWVNRISAARMLTWKARANNKTYALRIPITTGLATYQHMQTGDLSAHQLALLSKLDRAILDYRDPAHQPQLIGDLLGQTPFLHY